MSISSFYNSFTLSGITYQTYPDIRLNIKKRRVNILYKSLTDSTHVNLAHLMGEKPSPEDNLFLSDQGRCLPQNTIYYEDEYITTSGYSFTIKGKDFLVTDQFTTDTATQEETPLFFCHEFKGYNSSLSDWDNRVLVSFEILNQLMEPQTLSEYKLDSTTGKLYNNLVCSETPLEVFYVRYSVKVSGALYTYHELLNNVPAFHEASYDDLNEWNNLSITSKAYFFEATPGGQSYTITLPAGGAAKYAYKERDTSRIYAKYPTAEDVSEPWYLRITNGEFIAPVRVGESSYRSCKYKISEFLSQSFNPYYPYKFINKELSTWIHANLVKVSRNVVDDAGGGLYIDVVIYDADETAAETAYTTNSSLVGTTIGNATYQTGILSVNQQDGLIQITNTIPEDRKIYVNYYTEADEYDFTEVDFNPLSNVNILNQRIVIYIVPETTTTGSLSSSLHYLRVNKEGKVTFCSQARDGTGSIDGGTVKLLAEDFDTDGEPTHTIYYDKPSTASGLRWRPADEYAGVFAGYADNISFVDKYTVKTSLASKTGLSEQWLLNLQENPQFLPICEAYVGESIAPQALTELDVRVRGGGILEEHQTDALAEQPEAAWYWDDEQPYPGAGSFVVEIPQSLLADETFTLADVKDIVNRHVDFAHYPVIRTYGAVKPVIVSGIVQADLIDNITVSGTVQLKWPTYGPYTTYNVYYSSLPDKQFTCHNSSELTDATPMNSYSVSNLYPRTLYYFYIEAIRDDESSYSPVVCLRTDPYFV